MKQIEEMMVNAVNNKKNFTRSNTCVFVNENGVFVRLYNTIIFARVRGCNYYCDGNWPTVTTASRLRALGADYHIKLKEWKGWMENGDKLTPHSKMLNLAYNW